VKLFYQPGEYERWLLPNDTYVIYFGKENSIYTITRDNYKKYSDINVESYDAFISSVRHGWRKITPASAKDIKRLVVILFRGQWLL
jgi:hypothetical protein